MAPTAWRATTRRVPEAASVADAIDLVADRLGVIAATDEVGAQRVHHLVLVDRGGGGAQCLGDDLAAVEAAPRVSRAGADVRVGTVGDEIEHRRSLRRWSAAGPRRGRDRIVGTAMEERAMTIFEDLRASHEVQRSLARSMTHGRASAAHRRAAFLALAHELDAHATAEERHLYVPLLMDDAGLTVSRHALADHHKAEELVEQLRGVEPGDRAVRRVGRATRHRGPRPLGRGGARDLPARREAPVEVPPAAAGAGVPGRVRQARRPAHDVTTVGPDRAVLGRGRLLRSDETVRAQIGGVAAGGAGRPAWIRREVLEAGEVVGRSRRR